MAAILATFMANAPIFAQHNETPCRQNRADINELLDKRCQRMKTQLKMDEETTAKFTPLYKEYLNEIRSCHPTDYKRDRKTLTDAEKKNFIKKRFEYREKMVGIQKKYYDKFEKFLNAEQLETVFCSRHSFTRQCDRSHKRNHCDQSNYRCNSHERRAHERCK